MPGLAGMSGMQRRPFTIANAVGGATWATVIAVAGYLAGASYRRVEDQFGTVGEAVSVAVLAALVVIFVFRHFRRN